MIFSCINENQAYVLWDVFKLSLSAISVAFNYFTNVGVVRRQAELLVAIASISYKNSTAITSTLKLYGVTEWSSYTVACNTVRIQVSTRLAVTSE